MRFNKRELCVGEQHVARAYELLVLLLAIRSQWQQDFPEDAAEADRVATQAMDAAAVAGLAMLPDLTGGIGAQYEVFQSTQKEDVEPLTVALVGGASAAEAGSAEPLLRDPAGQDLRLLLPTDSAVPGMDVRYGPHGATVQRRDAGGRLCRRPSCAVSRSYLSQMCMTALGRAPPSRAANDAG